jgi:long-chain acyl-CoA synthetase
MITRNGFNVYPREIEQAVRELPGVTSVAARAIEQPDAEPDIDLDVEGTVSATEIKQWCEERLSAYKQPSAIRVH